LSGLGGGAGSTETVVNNPGTVSNAKPNYPNSTEKKSTEIKKPIIDPIEEYYSVLADDGRSLWAPPGVGPAYSVELLPPGLELFAVFSRDLWTGEKAGPVQKWLVESLPKWTSLFSAYPKTDDGQLKRVTLAAYPGAAPGLSDVVIRYELQSPIAIKDFLSLNSGYKDQKIPASETELYCWSNGTTAIVFDGFTKDFERQVVTITAGPVRIINTFAETGGGIAPLGRQLENLLSVSNSDMDMFVLTTPSYLYGNGREIYSTTPKFKDLLRDVIDDTIQSISLSVSLQDQFYIEGRMISADIAKSGAVLAKMRDSVDSLANKLEAQYAANPVAPYWRLIASRFPQMVRSVSRNTRMGLEGGQLVINAYQPRESFDNLAIATWMAIQDGGSGAGQAAVTPASKSAPPKLSIEDILNRPMSLAFAQESLEMSLAAIATEFNDSLPEGAAKIEMMINGGAFQKEGITQNQQIRDFSFEKTPLRDLLTALVRRANPVTTVQSPKEKDQKVVWVVLDSPNSPGGKKIELTTRTWVEANGATLPTEFLP